MSARTVMVYSDYKSPYAYLAKDLAYALEDSHGARLDWRPYVLDIPSYLGSARLDENGRVVEESRNAHQWRRVRYSYMDCRREAAKRGLVIRGTQKIWDSSLAAAGMLFAQLRGHSVFRCYHDAVFERFWRRALDIEQGGQVADLQLVAGELRKRDERDRRRKEAPLVQAPDAELLDTTGLSVDQVEDALLRIIRAKTSNGKAAAGR